MNYIEKLELQTEEVKEVETLEKHTIINNKPISVDKYLGHDGEFLALDGDYNDGFNQLNETNGLGINCIVSKRVNEIKTSLDNMEYKYYNLKQCGAKCDGKSDDIEIIENIIEKGESVIEIHIPYNIAISRPIKFKKNTRIKLTGKKNTAIRPTQDFNGKYLIQTFEEDRLITDNGITDNTCYLDIRDVWFQSDIDGVNGIGIINFHETSKLKDLTFNLTNGTNISVKNFDGAKIENIVSYTFNCKQLLAVDGFDLEINGWVAVGSSQGNCFEFRGAGNVTINQGHFECMVNTALKGQDFSIIRVSDCPSIAINNSIISHNNRQCSNPFIKVTNSKNNGYNFNSPSINNLLVNGTNFDEDVPFIIDLAQVDNKTPNIFSKNIGIIYKYNGKEFIYTNSDTGIAYNKFYDKGNADFKEVNEIKEVKINEILDSNKYAYYGQNFISRVYNQCTLNISIVSHTSFSDGEILFALPEGYKIKNVTSAYTQVIEVPCIVSASDSNLGLGKIRIDKDSNVILNIGSQTVNRLSFQATYIAKI